MSGVFANNFNVSIILCKVPYCDNYKFKILKCGWNPTEKKWCKNFSKKFYPSFDDEEYLDMINKFIISCSDLDIRIEYMEGLDELKEYLFNDVKKLNVCEEIVDFKKTKCVKCGVEKPNGNYHWCFKCFQDWEKQKVNIENKCLILDG